MIRAAALLAPLLLVGLILAFGPTEAASGRPVDRSAGPTADQPTSNSEAQDDLYRRRGYGTGGLTFGLRQGGTSMAGACADVSFARPRSCGPRGNYGIYGNGLGYGFGF